MADSLESILKDLREQLLTNVNAQPIADDACDKEIIPEELKTSINQAKSVTEANKILYQHLLQQGTQSKLKELCTIMINAKGYGRMIEFGQVLLTKITAPVEQCIEVCQQNGSDGIEVVDSHMLWQINRIAEQRTSGPVLALPTGPAFPGPPQPTPVRDPGAATPLPTAIPPPDTADIVEALNHQLDARWRHFGTFLRVDYQTMNIIETSTRGQPEDCMLDLLGRWTSNQAGTGHLPRTWQTVVEAVGKTGFPVIAENLAHKHGLTLSQ